MVMEEPSQDQFGEEEKVKILLHEYATLRTELLTRTNNVYQLIAIVAGLLVWILGRPPLSILFWLALLVVLVPFSYFYWLLSCDIAKAAKRVREIEMDINRRAGEPLLVWETLWGRQVTGYLGGKPLSPNCVRSQEQVEVNPDTLQTQNQPNPAVERDCAKARSPLNSTCVPDMARNYVDESPAARF